MRILETKRLILKPVDANDAEFIFELYNASTFLKFIGDRNLDTVEKAKQYILDKFLPSIETHGFGNYVCIEKESQKTIGSVGIFKRENLDVHDIGFSFLDNSQGKGYGYEAASRLIEAAKTDYAFTKIAAIVLENNVASRALIEKLGLVYLKDIILTGDTEELMYYEKTL